MSTKPTKTFSPAHLAAFRAAVEAELQRAGFDPAAATHSGGGVALPGRHGTVDLRLSTFGPDREGVVQVWVRSMRTHTCDTLPEAVARGLLELRHLEARPPGRAA